MSLLDRSPDVNLMGNDRLHQMPDLSGDVFDEGNKEQKKNTNPKDSCFQF